ncbi:MAG TPA: GNAT family N-acetyltransferase [Phycisphaerae bacterium]|nr:GNAT family N-acetyltransferase [Phycisphaerae bacterium]
MQNKPLQSVGGMTIIQISPTDPDFGAAFSFALSGQQEASRDLEAHCRNVEAMSRTSGVIPSVFVATDDRRGIQAAALVFESPGRSALVHLGPKALNDDAPLIITDAVIKHARTRKLNLLQTLLQPGDTRRARMMADMQFQYLAELIYMDCPIANSDTREPELECQFRLFNYDAETETMFLRALEESYKDSLDCPALTPLRTPADALAGHKATGIFDPSGFYVIAENDEPVAVLLTARVVDRLALEVVYMGVSSSGRRRGLGTLMLSLAKRRTQVLGLSSVTLAVDAINTPARRLYERSGFGERARRRAWIRCI